MEIRYYQKNGRVGATYRLSHKEMDQVEKEDLIRFFPAEDPWFDEIDVGLVPVEVQSKGKESIQAFVLKSCMKCHAGNLKKHRKIRDDYYSRMKNLNRAVSVNHDGKALEGRIVDDRDGVFVSLEKPFAPKKGHVLHSYRGHPLYDHEGYLMENILVEAKELLVNIYKQEMALRKHGKTVNLVEALNGVSDEEDA